MVATKKTNTVAKASAVNTKAATATAATTTAASASANAEATVRFPTSEEMVKMGLTTKSARIRHLHDLGMAIGAIAKQETGGLYQHAYNVIKKPLKKDSKVTAATAPAETEAKADVKEDESPKMA